MALGSEQTELEWLEERVLNVKKFSKRSRFFYNIFIPIVIIGTILIVGFGAYTYKKTYRSIQKNLLLDRHAYLEQIQGNLEQQIKTIEYSFTTYSDTQSFKNVINEPLTYRNFTKVREINSELAYIGVTAVNNSTYQLVSLSQGWQINNGALEQLSKKEINSLYQTVMKSDQYLTWSPTKEGLQMLLLLPTYSSEHSAVGIANIKNQTISQIVKDKDNEFLMILDRNGKLLYNNKKQKMDHDLQKQIFNQSDDAGYITDKHGNLYIRSNSDYNQWTFISRLSEDKIRKAAFPLETNLMIIMVLLWSAFMIISYIVAIKAYRPISKIAKILSLNDPNSGRTADMKQILLKIDNIVQKNTDFSLQIEKQKPELDTLFQYNLFRDRISKDSICKKLSQLGYQIEESESFAVMLIQVDNLDHGNAAAKDNFLLAINNLVLNIIPERDRFYPIVLNQDTQATIIRIPSQKGQKEIIEYCKNIREAARKYLGVKISMGISNKYTDLSKSKVALDNAKEALRFRINLGDESLIFFDEILPQLDEKALIKYPKKEEQKLLDAMRSADEYTIRKYFIDMFEAIIKENKNPITIENAILRLVNSIIQMGQRLGADYEVIQNSREIYEEVLHKDNLRQIQELLFQSLVLPIVGTIQNVTDTEMKNISDKMVVLVHKQYDQDICLESIADQLHYNSNYLSSVFKKEMGINFVDYLQDFRIDIAKKWLVESTMTIKEISERLRYNNPQNFIRFFKKKEKLTPGQYRKQNTGEVFATERQ